MDVRKATPGTVSQGTLRTEDLLDAFASELEHNVQRNAEAWCSDNGRIARHRYMRLVGAARECDPLEDETAADLVSELIDAIGEFAPAGHYFGAHPGDGADFGYWQSEED
jgi:hypothetical protein